MEKLTITKPQSTSHVGAGQILCLQMFVPRPHLNQLMKRHESDKDPTAYPSHTIITMPALSPTMTSGNIGTWQKNPGDTLAPGDVLVEIETDKAQMDFEFQEDGVLAKHLKGSGEKDVAVGNVSLRVG
jgi:biotin carboxyl carrier protein